MNTGVASTTASGWMTSIVPTPVPTPRPLRNPAKTDQMAPATALAPHSTSTSGIAAGHEPRQQHRQDALEQVAGDDDRRPFAARAPAARWSRPSAPSRSSADPCPPLIRATRTPTGIEPAR